ncbi:MAG: VWA domain-containing protein [Acidobacteriaceae bacterium]|nr:VWA domain-containing protein [Acidobacteriaceae bacterium]
MIYLRDSRRLFFLVCGAFYMSFGGFTDVCGQEDVSPPMRNAPHLSGSRRAPSRLRSDVQLVLIPVAVTDPLERPVLDLKRQSFRVFDDGLEQKISAFSIEEAAVSVGMVFDASNSMRRKIDDSREALNQFLRLSTPGDEFSLWKFSDRPQTVCPFTTNAEQVEENLALIRSGGWTSLFDALYLALSQMKRATHGTKALFVLSDGGDNNSRYSEGEIRNMVREADVRIFSISILDRSPVLERISDDSGGRAYRVHKLDELPEIVAKLSQEMHSHYVLGYVPTGRQSDGKYHKVVVRLVNPPGGPHLHLAWRRGYYAALH